MKKQKIVLLIILIGTLCLDQVTKLLITNNMEYLDSFPIIGSFFRITYVRNTGAAWSILEGKMIFFYLITLVALTLMVVFYRNLKDGNYLSRIGIVMMISGTLGNFIDRLFLQYVRDFLDFTILGYNFPVFNVADMCLLIGIGFIILDEAMKGLGYYTK